jgi:cell division protein FtsW (lipid II flippase)
MSVMSTIDNIVLWALCILLFCAGAFFVYVNFAVIYIAHFKKKHVSPAGLIGGGLCALSFWLCPYKAVRPWFWVPLVVDPGCLLLVCAFVYVVVFHGALKGAFKR